jgi:hypothetical protein
MAHAPTRWGDYSVVLALAAASRPVVDCRPLVLRWSYSSVLRAIIYLGAIHQASLAFSASWCLDNGNEGTNDRQTTIPHCPLLA